MKQNLTRMQTDPMGLREKTEKNWPLSGLEMVVWAIQVPFLNFYCQETKF